MTYGTSCGAERVKAGRTRATPWRHAVTFMCGGDVASHRFPLFRCQTVHTSDCGNLLLIPATAWRGCVKQIGKWLSDTQWLIQASACRHSIADTKSLVCARHNNQICFRAVSILKPWSPGGPFMVQKMAITFNIPVF